MGNETAQSVMATLIKSRRILRGEFVLLPGVLYYLCYKDSSVIGAAVLQSVGRQFGLIGGIVSGTATGLMDANAATAAAAQQARQLQMELDEKLKQNKFSFRAEPAQIEIKRGFWSHWIKVGKEQWNFYRGMEAPVRAALKAWCAANAVNQKGL